MSRPSATQTTERYVLRCKGSLDGYEFSDLDHALRWLSQKFVTDAAYSVEVQHVTYSSDKCPNCGYVLEASRALVQTLVASEFLGTYLAQEDEP